MLDYVKEHSIQHENITCAKAIQENFIAVTTVIIFLGFNKLLQDTNYYRNCYNHKDNLKNKIYQINFSQKTPSM